MPGCEQDRVPLASWRRRCFSATWESTYMEVYQGGGGCWRVYMLLWEALFSPLVGGCHMLLYSFSCRLGLLGGKEGSLT